MLLSLKLVQGVMLFYRLIKLTMRFAKGKYILVNFISAFWKLSQTSAAGKCRVKSK